MKLKVICKYCNSLDVKCVDGESGGNQNSFYTLDIFECKKCGKHTTVNSEVRGNIYSITLVKDGD